VSLHQVKCGEASRYLVSVSVVFVRKKERGSVMAHGLNTHAAWVLVSFAAGTANANIIVFEPDDFAPGTYVSRASADVTLWTFRSYFDTGYVPTFSPVYVAEDPRCATHPDDCAATTGTQVFQDAYGGIASWGAIGDSIGNAVSCFQSLGQNASTLWGCNQRFNVMLMEFTSLTDFVQIGGAFWAQDDTYLYAFDDAFNRVGFGSGPFDFPRCSYLVEAQKNTAGPRLLSILTQVGFGTSLPVAGPTVLRWTICGSTSPNPARSRCSASASQVSA
jgi:hypothetical protein